MSIVLTGAKGFVGRHLLRSLSSQGDRVVAIYRHGDVDSSLHAVEWVQADLSIPDGLNVRKLPDKIDVLYHLASWTPKRAGPQDVDAIASNNLLATDELLRALLPRTRRVVFASSIDVYGPMEGHITETTSTTPSTLYGAGKLLSESMVRQRCQAVGSDAVVLRLGNIYGPGEESYEKLVPATIRRVLAGHSPKILGDGFERRDLLFIDDLIAALVAASAKGAGSTINICSGTTHSIREIVSMILEISAQELSIDFVDRVGPPRGPAFDFDISKARTELGFHPQTTLSDGLRAEYNFSRSLAHG